MAISPSQGSTTQPRRMGRRWPVRRGSFLGRSEKARALPARAAASLPGWHAWHPQATPWRGRRPSPTWLRAGWCGLTVTRQSQGSRGLAAETQRGLSRHPGTESSKAHCSEPAAHAHTFQTQRGAQFKRLHFSLAVSTVGQQASTTSEDSLGSKGNLITVVFAWKGPGPV